MPHQVSSLPGAEVERSGKFSRFLPKAPTKSRGKLADRLALLARRQPLLIDIEEHFKKCQQNR